MKVPTWHIRGIAIETLLLAILCAVDMLWTVMVVLSGGAVEANPVMRFYLNQGIFNFVLMKSLLIGAPLVCMEVLRRRTPKFVTKMLRVGLAGYIIFYFGGMIVVNATMRPVAAAALRRP